MKIKKLVDVPLPGDEAPTHTTWRGAYVGTPQWHEPESKPWGMETDEELLVLCGEIHDEIDSRDIDPNDHDEYRVAGFTAGTMADPGKRIGSISNLTVALEDLYPLVMPPESYGVEELTAVVCDILGELESRGYANQTFENTLMSYNFSEPIEVIEAVHQPSVMEHLREARLRLDMVIELIAGVGEMP
jgi:hypothetical protein